MITAILPESILQSELPSVPAVAIRILNKKLLSKLIQLVSSSFPLPSYKRVINRDGMCLLLFCKVSQLDFKFNDCNEIPINAANYLINLIKCVDQSFSLRDFVLVNVPSTLPLTLQQNASCQWPVSFHPNKALENKISGLNFKDDEKLTVTQRVNSLLKLSDEASMKTGSTVNFAMVVNPITRKVLASASTCSASLLSHAAMRVIDQIAKSQLKTDQTLILEPFDDPDVISCNGKRKQELVPCDALHSTKKLKREKNCNDDYLCTGYHIYFAIEPCLMCTMALVHSRISRIFFGRCREDFGGVAQAKLQEITALNHSFEVYQVTAD